MNYLLSTNLLLFVDLLSLFSGNNERQIELLIDDCHSFQTKIGIKLYLIILFYFIFYFLFFIFYFLFVISLYIYSKDKSRIPQI